MRVLVVYAHPLADSFAAANALPASVVGTPPHVPVFIAWFPMRSRLGQKSWLRIGSL